MIDADLAPEGGDFARYIERLTERQEARLAAAALLPEAMPAAAAPPRPGGAQRAAPLATPVRGKPATPVASRAPGASRLPTPGVSQPSAGQVRDRKLPVALLAGVLGMVLVALGAALAGVVIIVAGIVIGFLVNRSRRAAVARPHGAQQRGP
jgi:hypothetical protein